MISREAEMKLEFEKQEKRFGLQQNKLDLAAKKHDEMRDMLKRKEEKIEEQNIKFTVLMDDIKAKEQELIDFNTTYKDLFNRYNSQVKLNEDRKKEFHDLKNKFMLTDMKLEHAAKANLDLQKRLKDSSEAGGDAAANLSRTREKIDGLEAENQHLNEEIKRLKQITDK